MTMTRKEKVLFVILLLCIAFGVVLFILFTSSCDMSTNLRIDSYLGEVTNDTFDMDLDLSVEATLITVNQRIVWDSELVISVVCVRSRETEVCTELLCTNLGCK